ncbi:MAG: YbaN family protein [Eubacteriaceae bacterium]|jgi:uncharacterized membrane protein YbaN (DUF454 family)|nr:YbaN family protein [Eubacteriaceae bacterium]
MVRNAFLNAAGLAALALGLAGALVPVLPTTPFVLLAAGCLSAGNPALYEKLAKMKYFGEYISHYRQKSGISYRTKAISLAWLWTALSLSIAICGKAAMKGGLAAIGIGVSAHVMLLKGPKSKGSVD